MANKETRILKSNTLEVLRQKANEVSLHLGDNELINGNIKDKTFNYDNVSVGSSLFHGLDSNNKTAEFEIKPEESIDNTAGYIILVGSPTIPSSFVAGAAITQSGGYNSTIVSATSEKILVTNSSGTFNSAQNLVVGSDNIPNANVVRIIAEAFPVGVVRVYLNSAELSQNVIAGGFHVVNYSGKVVLSGSNTLTDFVEGGIVYQGTNLASATFSATILRASSTELLFKNHTGSFNAGTQIKLGGSSNTITGANHGDLIPVSISRGFAIELNTPTTASTDDIKIYAPSLVDAVNELQDDIGTLENLDSSLGTDVVTALNNIEAVFDASTKEITAGSNAFNVTSGTFTIDSAGDVILDSNSGNITLKAGPTTFGQLDNSSGNILIKSGSTTMLTGSGANATFAQDITVTRDVDIDRNLNVDGNTTLDGTTIDGNLDLNGTIDVQSNATVNGNTILVGNLNTRGSNFLGNGTGDDTTISGDLTVNVNATISGATQLNGGLTMDTNKFVVANNTGNTSIAGTLDVDGATTLDGTTIDGDLDLNGSVDVSTNAVIHGTLDVDGNTTLDGTTIDGDLDLNGSADISTNLTVGGILNIGTLSTQFTAANRNNVKLALNELHLELGNAVITGTGTAAAGLTNLTAAINALDAEIGTVANYEGTIYGDTDISKVLVKLQTGVVNNDTNIADLFADVGSLTLDTGASDLTAAVNELHGEINSNDTDIGNIMKLIDGATTVDSSISFTGLSSTNIKTAIQELETEKIYLSSSSQQEIASKLGITGDVTIKDGGSNANKMVFNTGTTLDLSNANLLLPGNASNVNIFSTSFLEVDGNVPIQGFSVDRQHVPNITDKADVRLQWNENHADGTTVSRPARAWQLVGLNDSAASNTADIVTFYNAQELISSNTESGINVTWDASNQNFDFNVNDPTIQLSGDVAGSAVMNNLGSINISTTIQPNSVALGSDTTGNYIKTLTGTTNQVTVTPASHSEGKDATLSIPTDFRMPGTAKVLSTTNSTSKTTGALTVAGGVGINDDLYVGGDLVVQGDTVTLNTETLTVEDTLVLAGNNLSSEPTSGGFGLEVGPITSPSGVAAGVTGAHSIVYNYANNRWEADGSLILSSATLGSPKIEGSNYEANDNLVFNAGSGLSETVSKSGTMHTVQYTNTDRGSSQYIFKNIAANSGGTATANINNDTLTISGGAALTSVRSGDTITLNHNNITTTSTSATDDGTYVKGITVNAQGHVTNVDSGDFDDYYDNYNSWTIKDGDTTTYTITSGDTLQIASGAGITSNFTGDDILEIKHNDTSNVGNLSQNNSGNTFIQDLALTFDTFGHVTGATASTGTVSVGNGTLTLTGGGGIVTTIGDFTANQSSNETLTISHADTSNQPSSDNSGNTVIQDVFLDTYGHVTGLDTATITTVSNADNVNVDEKNDNVNYQVLFSANNGTGYQRPYIDTNDTHFMYNPNTSTLTAGTFNGALAWGNITGKPTLDNYSHWNATDGDGTNYTITSTDTLTFHEGNAGININFGADDRLDFENTMHTNNTLIKDDSRNTRGVTRLYRRDGNSDYSVQTHWTGTYWQLEGYTADTYHAPVRVQQAEIAESVAYANVSGTPTIGNGTHTISEDSAYLSITTTGGAFTADKSNLTTDKISLAATTSNTASNIVARDANGYIFVTYLNASGSVPTSGAGSGIGVMTGGNGTDNYLRGYNAAAVRSFINVENGATADQTNVTGSSGSCTGNSATATKASKVTVTNRTTENVNYFLAGVAPTIGSATGNNLQGSTAFYWNAGTTKLHAPKFSGDLSSCTGYDYTDLTNKPTIPSNNNQLTNGAGYTTYTSNQTLNNNSNVHFEGLMVGQTSGVAANTIRCVGDIIAYYSDDRLKNRIGNIENALDKVSQLNGFTFTPNQDAVDLGVDPDTDRVRVGVSAQEVEAVLPEAVTDAPVENDQDYKTVQYEKLVPLLIEAIKELKEENNHIRNELQALKDINS